MNVLVDTSAMYAMLDELDGNHSAAIEAARALGDDDALTTTNYMVVEAFSLVSRRLGMVPARELQRRALQAMEIIWTSPLEHAAATEAFLTSGRAMSFVDCATMATMRARRIDTILTFDEDFARAGFVVLPSPD